MGTVRIKAGVYLRTRSPSGLLIIDVRIMYIMLNSLLFWSAWRALEPFQLIQLFPGALALRSIALRARLNGRPFTWQVS